MLLSAILKLINSVWNKEELPDQWKESIIAPVYKKGDKTDCNNYRGISLLSTSYKIVSNLLLSRLGPYIDEITGDHQCGFRRDRSTTDQIFCIHEILEKWEYNETVHQLFIDFKQAYESVRREVLYSICNKDSRHTSKNSRSQWETQTHRRDHKLKFGTRKQQFLSSIGNI
jgi:hypothetical protein